jgi:hemerythrin-like domain-containing protein
MKITELLIAEHAVFCAVFDQIERSLPDLKTLGEAKLMGRLVESLLRGHGETEQELAYTALDHVLRENGKLDQLYSDHHEIDARLKHVQAARKLREARGLLQAALAASRAHFHYEEQVLLPLIEQVLQSETLMKLGELWAQQRAGLTSRAA